MDESTSISGRAGAHSRDTAPSPPARILVVDDSRTSQIVICSLLRRLGYDVAVAGNGREGLDLLARNPHDLVLMDIQMPDMNGVEATRVLRSREVESGGHLPIVALTAASDHTDRTQYREAGMDDVLAKPVDPERLAEALARWLPHQSFERPPADGHPPAGQSPTSSNDILDWDAALTLLQGNEAALQRLVVVFQAEIPQLLQQAQAAVTGRDAKSLRRVAHTIKGSARVFRAAAAERSAGELEQIAAAGDVASAPAALERLTAEVHRLAAALEAWRQQTAESLQ